VLGEKKGEKMLPKKAKRFSSILPKIKSELNEITDILLKSDFRFGNYNLHQVPVSGITYFAADAKSMNKFDHQSGRGCWRYLFDTEKLQYKGIAKEQDSGSYKMLS
jgi:hypothetical protein